MRYPTILAAALAASVVATPAFAESVTVQYSDLDLSSARDQQILQRRIDSATREACGMDKVVTGRISQSTAQRQCYAQTKTAVGDQVAQSIARENTRG